MQVVLRQRMLKCGQIACKQGLHVRALHSNRRSERALVNHGAHVDRSEKIRVHGDVHFRAAYMLVKAARLHHVAQ